MTATIVSLGDILNGKDYAYRINILIDQMLRAKKEKEPIRKYLGASRLGVSCSRALQYEYIRATSGKASQLYNPDRLRNFEIGHLFEGLMIEWLKLIGFKLITHDKQGKQLGFSVAGGEIAGHIDGVITVAPKKLKSTCPMLWETKTMNHKSWNDTVKKGLVLSKPVYAAQIALYQAYMEASIPGISKNPCLFTAINKDNSEIYAELVPFDSELAQRMSDKAVNIIKATKSNEILPRAYSSPDVFECKMCIYSFYCWNKGKPTAV